MDKHYNMYKQRQAVGEGLDGDLHEYVITRDNRAIITVYHTIPYDLSEFGVEGSDENNGTYINESMFQELDIETNELLFKWHATDHIPMSAMYGGPPNKKKGTTFDEAWDWFHINSVEKDKLGNYLISSRYTHALHYLDGRSGDVIWSLGGKLNNFTDLSDGRATSIARQHHARWSDDYTSITVFDNGDDTDHSTWRSRGLKVKLDTAAMTAEAPCSSSRTATCSSDWGNTGAWTEFSADGSEVLCDWQFEALHAGENGKWSAGSAETYRITSRKWHGYPLTPPVVNFKKRMEQFFVSWNGATELRHWLLEGSSTQGKDVEKMIWQHVTRFARQGFESNITLKADAFPTYKLTALDVKFQPLGSWAIFPNNTVQIIGGNGQSRLAAIPLRRDYVFISLTSIFCTIWAMKVWQDRRRLLTWLAIIFAASSLP